MLIKKKKRRRRLTLELILMTIVSLAAGILSANVVEDVAFQYYINRENQEEHYEQRVSESLDSLQRFISNHQVTKDNMEILFDWVQKEHGMYIMFYKDVEALMGSYEGLGEENSAGSVYNQIRYYDVTLMDGTKIKAEIDFYVNTKYFYVIDIASFAIGSIVFILLLFLLIHRKIRYINRLGQELKILGSGNLEYPMTIRGSDEITGLAEGIENLKNNILDQQLMKDEAENANAELVTAMSHDLRTPLTSLIGYLELLNMHRYEDEEQLCKYLEHCREKAFQMKKMSDRLFEYFLVYGKRENNYQFCLTSCDDLLEDLCNGQFFDWQEQGGCLACQIGELTGQVLVDSEYLQRVIDNLLSNLKKYGDIRYPLEIEASEQEQMLKICIRNHSLSQESQKESTQIGLRTCRKIMEEHKGAFRWRQDGDCFAVEMELPLQR